MSKQTVELKNIIDQINLTDINRTLIPTAAEYTFFSRARGSFFRIDKLAGHKTSLNKFNTVEIISSIVSDYSRMKQIAEGKLKKSRYVELNNTLLNH